MNYQTVVDEVTSLLSSLPSPCLCLAPITQEGWRVLLGGEEEEEEQQEEKTAEKWKSDRHRSENGILKRRWKNRTGPGVGGHMRGKWRKWRLMCYQLCDISFMPQRIGLRPFTLTWGNRNSCAQERNMTTCTWVWLLLMINLTLILIWHCLPLSLKDCKNTDPKMTPSMKKRQDCTF